MLEDERLTPTLPRVFFAHLYLLGLASALSVLFFRAWFTFPLNFMEDKHKVELTETGVRKHSKEGWFFYVFTLNNFARGGPDSLRWDEIKSLRHEEAGFTKLYPLPENAFKRETIVYKLLNKVAAFFDGLTSRVNTAQSLVFSTGFGGDDLGRNIKIDLADLSKKDRARLFYAVKNFAPHVKVTAQAEEKLLGSTVLSDLRYTKIWFDLLTSNQTRQRKGVLNEGDQVRNGDFTIQKRISTGGQASAYLATCADGTECVLKEFILAVSPTTGALVESAREFEAEVSLLSRIGHPGIVKLEDFFAEDGRAYVVLEYLNGKSLRSTVKNDGALSEKEVIRIALEVCEILSYLHGQEPPVVHRDITPENILLGLDGKVTLIDFSLALRQDVRNTTDSCGKHAYTPPEQFRDQATCQSDIYGLGATMFYVLTGVNPKPLKRSSPQLKSPAVSDALNRIVERATELDLNQRYESVDWLRTELKALE